MNPDHAKKVLETYAREIKSLTKAKSYNEILSKFDSSVALEITNSLDRQQLQNTMTADGNCPFFFFYELIKGII